MSIKGFTLEDTTNNLLAAIDGGNKKQIERMTVILLGGAAIDLNRIADAVEKLTKLTPTGVNLTQAEAETIAALRRGDIRVVDAPPSADEIERVAMQRYREQHPTVGVVWSQLSDDTQHKWRADAEYEIRYNKYKANPGAMG